MCKSFSLCKRGILPNRDDTTCEIQDTNICGTRSVRVRDIDKY